MVTVVIVTIVIVTEVIVTVTTEETFSGQRFAILIMFLTKVSFVALKLILSNYF